MKKFITYDESLIILNNLDFKGKTKEKLFFNK